MPTAIPCTDVYVTKFSPSGSVIYSTLLGGTGNESSVSIAANAAGEIYILGLGTSSDLPVTANAMQANGTGPFLAKLSADGSKLLYSSYLNLTATDVPLALALDGKGDAFIAIISASQALTPSANAYRRTPAASFVMKIDMTTGKSAWGTYYDAPLMAMALDTAGNVSNRNSRCCVHITSDNRGRPSQNTRGEFRCIRGQAQRGRIAAHVWNVPRRHRR